MLNLFPKVRSQSWASEVRAKNKFNTKSNYKEISFQSGFKWIAPVVSYQESVPDGRRSTSSGVKDTVLSPCVHSSSDSGNLRCGLHAEAYRRAQCETAIDHSLHIACIIVSCFQLSKVGWLRTVRKKFNIHVRGIILQTLVLVTETVSFSALFEVRVPVIITLV